METRTRIGFVGTGRMGAAMAEHLHDAGFTVAALYDVSSDSAERVAQLIGARSVRTLAEVTAACDVVITVVTDDAAMDQIYAESGDSLLRDARDRTFINCATVTPALHVEIERRARARGAASLEACLASSIPQARDGSLFIMAGGRREVFDRLSPLLEAMSASLIYVGESGSAAQVKALVNMVMNINTAGLAEGLGLGDALGFDLTMLRHVFAKTGADSRVLHTDGEDMQNRDHAVFFSAAHAAKDSAIALSLAHAAGVRTPLARAAFDQFSRMAELGLGDLDKSGVSELTFRSRHGAEPAG